MAMKITIDIDEKTWEVLKPILEPMILNEQQQYEMFEITELQQIDRLCPIDKDAILGLRNGTRILNILLDGCWGDEYSPLREGEMSRIGWWIRKGKSNLYSVKTVADLKKVTKKEYLKHRNAGLGSWRALEEYILTL